jgi:hypothetical protein
VKLTGVDWFKAFVDLSREAAALAKFAGSVGCTRGQVLRGCDYSVMWDHEWMRIFRRNYPRFHVASGDKLVTFQVRGDKPFSEAFYDRVSCPVCAGFVKDGKHKRDRCRFRPAERPLTIIGDDLFIGFNAAARQKMAQLAATPHEPNEWTRTDLWGPIFSNLGAEGPDARMGERERHARQADSSRRPAPSQRPPARRTRARQASTQRAAAGRSRRKPRR